MKSRSARALCPTRKDPWSTPPGAKSPSRRPAASRAAKPSLPLDAIDIDANRRLLNRYRFVQHEGMRILAGWLPKAPNFELKCEMGRSLWEDALHVNALYLRLREIQSPAFQKPSDDALVTLMNELIHAPDEFALALGLYRVVTPSLIEALASHETATFPNSDLPTLAPSGRVSAGEWCHERRR